MRWRSALLLGLSWLAAGAPLRADPAAALAVLKACPAQSAPGLRGIEAVRTACPEIATALRDLGLEGLLPGDWKARISPSALGDWSVLANRYARPTPATLPSPSSLQAIARHLQPPPSSLSWWEQFKAWLGRWLQSDRNRWPGWLRALPNWGSGARFFVYGVIVLLVIAAAAVVALELRAAGVFGARRRRPAATPAAKARHDVTGESPTDADLDAAPAHLRPVILLRLLVTALTRSRRLDREGALTCRELIAAARFDTPGQREIFTSVVLSAERALYGDPPSTAQPLNDALLDGARSLYGQLVASSDEQPVR